MGRDRERPQWIILDGDLDANWIESMNSVMDDNRVLTLANGDRINLYGNMRMLLEIRNLQFATPATVSRGGVLFIYDFDGWQWRSFVEAWIANSKWTKNKETIENIHNFFFKKYIPKALDWLKKEAKRTVPCPDMCMVETLTKMMDALVDADATYIEQWFVFCAV